MSKPATLKALIPEVIKDLEKGLTFNESADRLSVMKTNKSTLKRYVRESTDLPLDPPEEQIDLTRMDTDSHIYLPQRIEIKTVEVKGKTYYDVTPLIIDCGG